MAKKHISFIRREISDILTEGTPRQRMLLITNHLAEISTGKEGFLSEFEFEELRASFKTPLEIKLYTKYKNADDAIRGVLPYLAQLRLLYKGLIAKINNLTMLVKTFSQMSELLNEVLIVVNYDSKLRNKLIETFIEKHFSYASPIRKKVDSKEYIEFEFGTHEDNLLESINRSYKEACQHLSKINAVIKALKDFMAENRFQIRAYNAFIEEVEEEVSNTETRETLELAFGQAFSWKDHTDINIDENEYNHISQYL